MRLGDARFVYLDPDGTLPDWLAVVVRQKTGVVYGTQCAGLAVEQRLVEGYLVPVGGAKFDVDEGMIDTGPFREVFHKRGACQWRWTGTAFPPERFKTLRKLVEAVSYWHSASTSADATKLSLRLDVVRADEIAEAWVPVETPDGPGVLLYRNCD